MTELFALLVRLPRAVRRSWEDSWFRSLVTVAAVALVFGTLFYWQVEGWSMLDSFYFCVITLTTVGYGDLTPATMAGKVFTILYAFTGTVIILAFIYVGAKGAIRRRGARNTLLRRSRSERAEPDEGEFHESRPD